MENEIDNETQSGGLDVALFACCTFSAAASPCGFCSEERV